LYCVPIKDNHSIVSLCTFTNSAFSHLGMAIPASKTIFFFIPICTERVAFIEKLPFRIFTPMSNSLHKFSSLKSVYFLFSNLIVISLKSLSLLNGFSRNETFPNAWKHRYVFSSNADAIITGTSL